ncbi:hypothetical protein ETU09_01525 [Apibacter muscae]|uniref:Uncharacterized protein n=1 Tax=Apibacter muscae TaxID=2509004 RepID=A0A563DJB5_9FLAO|nr:hypothetical protein [Apibacter muscae]TWP30227.1 hypothetical protein ETU09_01525 [Apibacter muscae]
MDKLLDILLTSQDFREENKKDLKIYELWFEENKEKLLQELEHLVQRTPGYENWKMDYSKESLEGLGKWLKENVETEKLGEEDYEKVRASVPDYIDIDDWTFTPETRAILLDAGIYFGEVFIRNHSGLKWEQYFSTSKNKDIDHGNMVIPLKKSNLSPVNILFVLGYGLVDGSRGEDRLKELYEVWEEYL